MGEAGVPVRPVAVTEEGLRELGRSDREARERRAAMSRAERAGRLAGGTVLEVPQHSAEEVARFGTQMSRIESSSVTMPDVDAALSDGGRRRRESLQLAGSLREAEQSERRSESEHAQPSAT
jgi:hypothetical protein